mgnify:CR=1 FL=1
MGEDLLDKRKEKLIEILKNKKFIWVYLAIILIAVFGFNIRTNNVGVLGGYLLILMHMHFTGMQSILLRTGICLK